MNDCFVTWLNVLIFVDVPNKVASQCDTSVKTSMITLL